VGQKAAVSPMIVWRPVFRRQPTWLRLCVVQLRAQKATLRRRQCGVQQRANRPKMIRNAKPLLASQGSSNKLEPIRAIRAIAIRQSCLSGFPIIQTHQLLRRLIGFDGA
jgi:hypothetical protein